MEVDFKFVCHICDKFGGNSFRAVLRHVGEVHKHDPNFFIRCGIHHCPQTYTNFFSFRSHVYRKHRDFAETDTGQMSNDGTLQDGAGAGEYNDDESAEILPDVAEFQQVAATFVLKTREEYRIPQSTVDKLLQDVTGFVSSALSKAKHDLMRKAEGIENVEQMSSIVSQSFDADVDPFAGLQTEYQQTAYYKNHFNYLVCVL